jgi:hypothetical protein
MREAGEVESKKKVGSDNAIAKITRRPSECSVLSFSNNTLLKENFHEKI